MRVYTYLSEREILVAGAKGIVPVGNLTMADKYLVAYARKNNIYLKYGNKSVPAYNPFIIGSVILRSKILEDMIIRKGKGLMVFYRVNHLRENPVFVTNYDLKTHLGGILTFGDKDGLPEHIKSMDMESGKKELARLYWNSAISVREYYQNVKKYSTIRYPGINVEYATYKYNRVAEVISYVFVPPTHIFVKWKNKKYIPFMDWLYKHRGLYMKEINSLHDAKSKKYVENLYKEFLSNYKKYEEHFAKRVREKDRVSDMYVA